MPTSFTSTAAPLISRYAVGMQPVYGGKGVGRERGGGAKRDESDERDGCRIATKTLRNGNGTEAEREATERPVA